MNNVITTQGPPKLPRRPVPQPPAPQPVARQVGDQMSRLADTIDSVQAKLDELLRRLEMVLSPNFEKNPVQRESPAEPSKCALALSCQVLRGKVEQMETALMTTLERLEL
jgi:hypothetical protein